jgi:hypothetical protein
MGSGLRYCALFPPGWVGRPKFIAIKQDWHCLFKPTFIALSAGEQINGREAETAAF